MQDNERIVSKNFVSMQMKSFKAWHKLCRAGKQTVIG